jgi:transglutaminase-like putative cysteine protease
MVTSQLRVVHRTGYSYPGGAVASYNEARMTPQSSHEQVVLHTRVDITPTPWMYSYTDYWGTRVTAFEVHERHDEMGVVSTTVTFAPAGGCRGRSCAVPRRRETSRRR